MLDNIVYIQNIVTGEIKLFNGTLEFSNKIQEFCVRIMAQDLI